MCEKSTIRKRHMHLTEDILKKHPSICSHMEPSLNTRHDIVAAEVPKLGKEARRGPSRSGASCPRSPTPSSHHLWRRHASADYQLTRLLGLSPTRTAHDVPARLLRRCHRVRMAKDIAENNRCARGGLTIHLLKDVGLISQNIEQALEDAFKPPGIHDRTPSSGLHILVGRDP
ncbi:hypothetical protein ZWY2020_054459 [Hordeum vulgare]|nr:hypothetical protein ZWY2020_054459 [Hordeum vulgare]